MLRGRGMGDGAHGDPAATVVATLLAAIMMAAAGEAATATATWCIARSGASPTALQTALDYACGAGADCTPIQPSGLCYLPNTVQAHASYAFNSFYQRSNMAPGTCDFAGTATVTVTDPSFGSCTYPSSVSSAGGTTPSTNTPTANLPSTTPTSTTPPTFAGGTGVGGTGLTPGFGPATPDTSIAAATRGLRRLPLSFTSFCCCIIAPLLIYGTRSSSEW